MLGPVHLAAITHVERWEQQGLGPGAQLLIMELHSEEVCSVSDENLLGAI